MTLKEYLESYDEPLNEGIGENIKETFLKAKIKGKNFINDVLTQNDAGFKSWARDQKNFFPKSFESRIFDFTRDFYNDGKPNIDGIKSKIESMVGGKGIYFYLNADQLAELAKYIYKKIWDYINESNEIVHKKIRKIAKSLYLYQTYGKKFGEKPLATSKEEAQKAFTDVENTEVKKLENKVENFYKYIAKDIVERYRIKEFLKGIK